VWNGSMWCAKLNMKLSPRISQRARNFLTPGLGTLASWSYVKWWNARKTETNRTAFRRTDILIRCCLWRIAGSASSPLSTNVFGITTAYTSALDRQYFVPVSVLFVQTVWLANALLVAVLTDKVNRGVQQTDIRQTQRENVRNKNITTVYIYFFF
jgi:hypothetical protein